MIRYAALALALTAVGFIGWAVGRYVTNQSINPVDPAPTTSVSPSPTPVQSPNPTRAPDPILGQLGERIIERTETVREGDDDDDDEQRAPAPRVTVIVRTPSPTPARTTPAPAPSSRPPLLPDVKIPQTPIVEVPDLNLPLLR